MRQYSELHIGKFDIAKTQEFAKTIGTYPQIAQLLLNRGITNKAEYHLNFSINGTARLFSPKLLPDIEMAVDLLQKALEEQQLILICGDYDVDGITAISILLNGLRAQGGQVEFDMPSRLREGYGMHLRQVDRAVELGASLLISVDCGSSNAEVVEYAHSQGLKVIISDHHLLPPNPPQPEAFVNPKRPDSQYPEPMLCGAAVAWKILCALYQRLELALPTQYLDCVALATIADMVPLKGENRLLCSLGLKEMGKWNHSGMRALATVAKVLNQNLTASAIGFYMAPRINSPGRIDDPERCVRLFTTTDNKICTALAEEIDELNHQRLDLQNQVIDEIKTTLDLAQARRQGFILMVGEWHSGVLGLASGRLMNDYRLPCLVASPVPNSDGLIVGSGRSPKGTDLYAILSECADLFVRFGGHSAAAGFSLKSSNLETLRQRLIEIMPRHLQPIPPEEVDFELQIKDIKMDWVNHLLELEPTGREFSQPCFLLRGVRVSDLRLLKDGQYYGGYLVQESSPGCQLKMTMFNSASDANSYKLLDKTCDVVCTLEIDNFRKPQPKANVEYFVAADSAQQELLRTTEYLDTGLAHELAQKRNCELASSGTEPNSSAEQNAAVTDQPDNTPTAHGTCIPSNSTLSAAPAVAPIRYVNDQRHKRVDILKFLKWLKDNNVLEGTRVVVAYPQRRWQLSPDIQNYAPLIEWKALLQLDASDNVSDLVFADPPLHLPALRQAPVMRTVNRVHLIYSDDIWRQIDAFMDIWSVTAAELDEAWALLHSQLKEKPISIATAAEMWDLSRTDPRLHHLQAVIAICQDCKLLTKENGHLQLGKLSETATDEHFWPKSPLFARLSSMRLGYEYTRELLQKESLTAQEFWQS